MFFHPVTRMTVFLLWAVTGLSFLGASGRPEAPPLIQMEDQPRQFLAPGNLDAKVRSLVLPFSTLTFTARDQVIKSWIFTVFDSSGKVVSEQSRMETRDRGFFGELFNIGLRPQVEVPRELTWDGTYHRPEKAEDGTLVPDGNYTYQITILDSAGGRAQTPPFNATVKNARISVDFIRISRTVFAPLGTRKTVTVEQSGTREYHWEGHFTTAAGTVIRTLVWDNPTDNQNQDLPPPTFSWDGRDDRGAVVPDGAYTYTLVGHNRAGLVLTAAAPQVLQVSERSGTVNLTSSLPRFSPKAVGAPATLQFQPEVGTIEGMAQWRISVIDPARPGIPRWTASGTGPVPGSVEFRGLSTAGLPLPEGRYQAILSVAWDNGNSAESLPLPFDLVLAPPKAVLSASAPVFGGSGRAGVTLTFQGEPGLPWDLDVFDRQGKALRHYALGDSGAGTIEFQGLDEGGQPFADGTITVKASARNQAGVPGAVQVSVRKDSRPMPVGLDLSRATLVPGHGTAGVVRITPILGVVDSIERTVLTVSDLSGGTVALNQADSIITFWDWNSLGPDRKPVADGAYRIDLAVTYTNGTLAHATTGLRVDSQFLDNEGPQVDFRLSSAVFAPENIDGPESLVIEPTAQPGASALAQWSLTVVDPRGKPFRTFTGKASPPARVVWDGKSERGEYAESGEEYQVIFHVTDTAGRSAKKTDQVTIDILVNKLPDGRYKIIISSIQFEGYSSDVLKQTPVLLARNLFVLQRLALVLNRLTEYKIALEGYAVSEFSTDPPSAAREQAEVLLPLSRDRAQEVRTALVLLGVEAGRFSVQGFGALQPLVPNTDLENRWKNRRVEFSLEKKP